MTEPANEPRPRLDIGDEIEVYGMRFILTEVSTHLDGHPRVVFKQPIQLIQEGRA